MSATKFQVEAMMVERGCFGWYVLDWDFEGYEKDVAGPYRTKREAINRAIELSYAT